MVKDKNGGVNHVFVLRKYTREQAILLCSKILSSCGIKNTRYKTSIYVSNIDFALKK